MRPDKINYYLNIAKSVAARATCLRRQFGAVIVKDDRIVSTGYNGAASGVKDCLTRGVCKREELGIPSGERYELCVSVHAEQNAIISASREEMKDATIYIHGNTSGKPDEVALGKPCVMCQRMIINSGIKTVVCSSPTWLGGYEILDVYEMIESINKDLK